MILFDDHCSSYLFVTNTMEKESKKFLSPVDLYLIFKKSSCKNQVQQTGFLACKKQFQLDF